MSNYQDYGYQTTERCYSHDYLFGPIQKLIKDKKDLNILDLGCGNGALVNELIQMGYKAYGTDASVTGIEQASRVNPSHFAVQDLSKDTLPDPFDKIPFHVIISTEVIEHLYDPRGFIKFAKQILQQAGGGEIILSTPYHGYLKNLVISIFGKWDNHADPLWDGGHIKLWSKATLNKLLTEQGFVVEKFIGCGRFPFMWKSMIIKARI